MTRLVRTNAALEAALAQLRTASVIALDTEFHLERSYFPQLMLIQLRGDDGEAVLVDPLGEVDLALLGAVLTDATLVVHGGATDLQILSRDLGVRVGSVFDTQIAAGFAGLGYPLRLQELAQAVLGRHMTKTETLSDWSRRPLTGEQAAYAADDVLVLAELRVALLEEIDRRGHGRLLHRCTEEVVERALAPEEDGEAWRSVGGGQHLDGWDRQVLGELAAWRQREARERRVPRHTVVSDSILCDIARRQPRSVDALKNNRRLPTNVWKREGEALVACVARALRAPPPAPRPTLPRGWADLVRAAARVAESRSGIATELALGDAVLARIAEGLEVEAWRREALGVEFFSFIEGRSEIRMPPGWVGFATS